MDINTYFSLAVLLTPGILMVMLRRCVTPVAKNYFSGEVINFVWYSILNTICYVWLAPQIHYPQLSCLLKLESFHKHLLPFIVFTFFLPMILGFIFGWLDKWKVPLIVLNFLFHKKVASTIPTMWEEIFNKNLVGNITVKLKNGDLIKGVFADDSGVSSSVAYKDMYIKQITEINSQPVNTYQSMWLDGNEITYIAFEKGEQTLGTIALILAKGVEVLAKILKKLDDIFLLSKEYTIQNHNRKGDSK